MASQSTGLAKRTDEYLQPVYHGLRTKNKSFNATLKTSYEESIGSIYIIPQDIGRVILNLITNAFYVVDEKKKVLQRSKVLKLDFSLQTYCFSKYKKSWQ